MSIYEGWMARIRQSLAATPCGTDDEQAAGFFRRNYQANWPVRFDLPRWPAFDWTLQDLGSRIGLGTLIEAQWARTENAKYEIESPSHKRMVSFGAFLRETTHGRGNDVYLTAQNSGANRAAFGGLWEDVSPLPSMLQPDPSAGYLWLGRDTVTPLHHDETNNLMCQVMGRKHVRLFPPQDRDLLSPTVGVHSDLGWVTDEMIYDLHLNVHDVWLNPGEALFLPIGWWHCVQAYDVACTIVYTSFIWPNFWGRVTD